MGYMSDYYAAKDAEYEASQPDERTWMQIYLESKDAEESE